MTPIDEPEADPVDAVLSATDESDDQDPNGPDDVDHEDDASDDDTSSERAAPRGKTKYRMPQEFKGHPWAEGINSFVDELDPKGSKLPQRALLGESYVATFVEVMKDEIHPAWIAGVSTVLIGGVIGFRIYSESAARPPKGKEGGLGLADRLS